MKKQKSQWTDSQWYEVLKAKMVFALDVLNTLANSVSFVLYARKARLTTVHEQEMAQLKQTHKEELDKADQSLGEKAVSFFW